jgi:hypothetical protein
VTIDGGAPQTLTYTWTAASNIRVVIGSFPNGSGAFGISMSTDAPDSTKRWSTVAAPFVPSVMGQKTHALPRLRFETSILIRGRSSVGVTTTTLNERQAGATYILD